MQDIQITVKHIVSFDSDIAKVFAGFLGGSLIPPAMQTQTPLVEPEPVTAPILAVTTEQAVSIEPTPKAEVSPGVVIPTPTVETIPVAAVPTVPTAVATFNIDQIIQAAAILADTSDENRERVLELVRYYNIEGLADLPADQFGNFATQLRGMGAKI